MKKHLMLIICLVLLLLVPSLITAEEDQVYYIPDKNMSVSVPPELVCVTRNSGASSTFYHKGFGNYDDVQSAMRKQDINLYGVSKDRQYELTVQCFDYNDIDFNTADDSLLSEYAEQIMYSLGWWTAENKIIDIYDGKTNKAIRIQCKLETLFAGDQYIILYCATYGSDLLKLQFLSYGKEITQEQETMVQGIFDSIEWYEKKEPDLITDQEMGISYKVPSYWKLENGSEKGTKWPVSYHIGTDDVWISYDREDLWAKYYADNRETADRYGVTRWNYFDFKDVRTIAALQFGCADKMIRRGVFADNEYLYSDEQFRSRDQEKTFLFFSNGYVYKFCLNGLDAYNYIDQMKEFLSSVEYLDLPENKNESEEEPAFMDAEPFELTSGIYHVGNDIAPGVYYVRQAVPSDYGSSSLYLYAQAPSDEKKYYVFGEHFKFGEVQKKVALIEKGEYVEISGGDLTFCLSPIPDDYYQFEIPEGTYMPIGYYTVGVDIPAGLYSVLSGSVNGGCITVFPAGTEPDDSGMYIHLVTCQESAEVGANNIDGKTIVLRDGKVVCVDAEVVLRKVRDLTDEEKVEEPPEWEW